eukprot:1101295-Prorocentrum_minimum.AAC.1
MGLNGKFFIGRIEPARDLPTRDKDNKDGLIRSRWSILRCPYSKPRSRRSASHVAVSVSRDYTSNIRWNIRNDVR